MKNLKKGFAVALSLAMSIQFGLADSYYLNALADEVSPEQEVETTSTEQPSEEVEAQTVEQPVEETEVQNEQKELVVEENNEDSSQEENLSNEMSVEDWFNYLMSVSADEMDALYEKYPNLNDIISKMSQSQQDQLSQKFGNSEEDIEAIHDGKEEQHFASVGDTIELQGSESPEDEKYYHAWTVTSGKDVVSINNFYGSKGICYAKAEGKAVVRHYYTQNYQYYYYDDLLLI